MTLSRESDENIFCLLNYIYSEILLDILPTSINPETGKVLLDLIRDNTIRGIRARLSIQAMALTVKPTPELAKYLMVSIQSGLDIVTDAGC